MVLKELIMQISVPDAKGQLTVLVRRAGAGLSPWRRRTATVIAVDPSASMASVLNEPEADSCIATFGAEDRILISAGTVAEALIVSARRNAGKEVASLVNGLGFGIVSVTRASAWRVARAFEDRGKGVHEAAPDCGDCFAHEVAKENSCRLLHAGDDFSRTGIEGVLLSGRSGRAERHELQPVRQECHA